MNKNNTLLKTVLSLSKLNDKFKNSRLRIISSNRVYLTKFNFFKYICSSDKFRETPYSDILINYFYKSEKIYPGSSYLLSCYIVNLILKNNNIFENENNIEKNLENVIGIIFFPVLILLLAQEAMEQSFITEQAKKRLK